MTMKSKHPAPRKFPAEARKLEANDQSELAKMRDKNRRPMKGSKLTKGARRRVG